MGKRIRDKQPVISVENNSTSTSTSTSHQGRAWGILQIIKYNQLRHHVKKRLTHRKHGAAKNPAKIDISGSPNSSGVDSTQEHYIPEPKLSNVEEMSTQSTPPGKQSVKARLKALIAEEITRKKGQHKRSSTYPVKPQPTQASPTPNLGHSDLDESLPTQKNSHLVLLQTDHTLDELPPSFSTSNSEICVECGTVFSCEFMGNNNNQIHKHHKHHKQPSEQVFHKAASSSSSSSCKEKSMQARLLTTDVSPHLFKDFLDTLDIISVNKDMLLKFLQHPRSPLAYHIHNQQATSGNNKAKLSKAVSFPVTAGSSSSSGVKGQNMNKMVDERVKDKGETQAQSEGQTQRPSLMMSKSLGKFCQQPESSSLDSYRVHKSSSSSSSSVPIVHVPNQRVINRFKDLRQKLKHVIEESKSEKRRITMDAIFHKIPHGNKVSKELKRKILEKSKDPAIMGEGAEIGTRNLLHASPMRTSSLNASVWRYSQLYETCFNKESKYPKSERLKLKTTEEERGSTLVTTPKTFQRFLSLPNLETYFSQNEESSVLLPPQIPVRKFGEKTTTLSITDEQNCFGQSELKNQVPKIVQKRIAIQSDTRSGSDDDKEYLNQKESMGTDDDYESLIDSDDDSNEEEDSESSTESTPVVVDAKSISLTDSSFLYETIDIDEPLQEDSEVKPEAAEGPDLLDEHLQEEKTADSHHEVVRSEEDFLKFGILNRRLNLDIPGLEVDASIEGEFNYVRDVLELSGFMGHDSPAMWYSNDQPVDPIVYEELEGCLLFDPECSDNVNQENDNCNHLLLFDLVNEVLVEIFGRSYSYYPKPLSSLSHVHPLPVGDHVLRQVWTLISWYLSSNNAELFYPSLDYYVSRDLARSDGWMNLQFDSECVGLELDDLIFDDLLEEIICS